MPPRDWRLRLRDILDAADRIRGYTSAMDLGAFSADRRTVAAVLYELIVIGEAAGDFPEDVQALHPDVPWKAMRGLRNVVAHRYFAVSLERVWKTLTADLPPLVESLRRLGDRQT